VDYGLRSNVSVEAVPADPKGVASPLPTSISMHGAAGMVEKWTPERVLGRSRSVTPTAMVVATEPECTQAPNPIALARRSASAAD
jgi:hypothetical protein